MSLSPRLLAPVCLLGMSVAVWKWFEPLKHVLTSNLTGSQSLSGWIVLATGLLLVLRAVVEVFRPQLKFIWHVFLAPIGASNQKERLEKFYEGQADIYDATRNGFLRGRNTMMSLSAAHLRVLRASAESTKRRLVWIDIGGGTGYNMELMDQHIPISSFDAVYLIDLCEPLLQVARKRFAKRGWHNVHVLCQDASNFTLPEWSDGKDPKGSVGFVTLSYSLSMIPSFYTLLDRIDYVLSPDDGLLSVVDFYTSGRQLSLHEKAIGGIMKECGWLSRWFWQIWFDFDHVSLSPQRREYLEYKFGTVKTYNGRNRFIIPFLVRIPYYVWLGRSRSCDVSRLCHAFEVEGGNVVGSPSPRSLKAIQDALAVPLLDIGEPAVEAPANESPVVIDVTHPLTSFHYQIKNPWRLPYYEHPVHKEFRTFIYSFTWEDPLEDMKHLDLTEDDSMFVITSAGDNALHYAIASNPKRIHCVDMNPCQGHLFELKLAAIQALSYEEFFAMFGDGCQTKFRTLLDTKLSPFLSSICYQFWRLNSDMFSSSFYLSGYSGWALRFARSLFWLVGITKDVEDMCKADTIAEQERLWNEKLRPVLLNSLVVYLLRSPVFCWNALGVPQNQRRMLLDEGTAYDFIKDTLDPIPSTALLKDGAYHYLLTLLGHYTKSSCPLYLTREGFDALRLNDSAALDAFRIHTDSIINVLRGLTASSLTRAVIMDHLDWFSPGAKEVQEEVAELYRVLAPGGFVLWRSAATQPWYSEAFVRAGFTVSVLGVRKGNKRAIDRVNMYASFWRAQKL
ncbi:S-adenosyl-L-methionine-dependent methyltransferase [Rickenella mellea]|uniref:S-adenosyl-L-methionine-dependent methyltransferase n=1 Tax=Rickenella mellea TaxID=50990 RepID=A0A4Y7QFF2_9AGAM|nr:S-adenosyl-L-methionine-dependent methyltransferase [Rickenella mellea]